MKKNLNICLVAISTLLFVSFFTACKNQNKKDQQEIAQFADIINSQPETKISEGITLVSCNYQPGDSLFVYNLKVTDNHFNGTTIEETKDTLRSQLRIPAKQKFVRKLVDNKIGLQYMYETPSDTISIVFSSVELSTILQEPYN